MYALLISRFRLMWEISLLQLEKDLMVSIPTWEEEYRKPFLVNGVSIYEVLSETMNASEAGKENRKVILADVSCLWPCLKAW